MDSMDNGCENEFGSENQISSIIRLEFLPKNQEIDSQKFSQVF